MLSLLSTMTNPLLAKRNWCWYRHQRPWSWRCRCSHPRKLAGAHSCRSTFLKLPSQPLLILFVLAVGKVAAGLPSEMIGPCITNHRWYPSFTVPSLVPQGLEEAFQFAEGLVVPIAQKRPVFSGCGCLDEWLAYHSGAWYTSGLHTLMLKACQAQHLPNLKRDGQILIF